MDNEEQEDETAFPFDLKAEALQDSWYVVDLLRNLKQQDAKNGRLWAIALTDAEKLHAWIGYAIGTVDTTKE